MTELIGWASSIVLLLHNGVFVVTHVPLIITAICGQVIYLRNRRLAGSASAI